MKRALNAWMKFTAYIRQKTGKKLPVEVSKMAKPFYSKAKAAVGDNATPDQILKKAKELYNKK